MENPELIRATKRRLAREGAQLLESNVALHWASSVTPDNL